MHATLPLLEDSDFPPIQRKELTTLQVNLGYKCNQQCLHCHVNAGPNRKEMMDEKTVNTIIDMLSLHNIKVLDLTGGAPELSPHFRVLVSKAHELGVQVMDRCNLTILEESGQEDLTAFLAQNQVTVVASLPCYLKENVDGQRGKGVFDSSIRALLQLNELGYGKPGSGLVLNLVYNPQGPVLPPPQEPLEQEYHARLLKQYGIRFNGLFTLTNMPIQRFGSTLISKNQFQAYMDLLKGSYNQANLEDVMCKSIISVDWQGYMYDCDFNQMLDLPLGATDLPRIHISKLADIKVEGEEICVRDHCYACTAGQGSSCGGALS